MAVTRRGLLAVSRNAHLRLAAHIAARLGQHTDEDEVQNAPGPWLERTGWVHFDAEGLPCRIDEPDYTQAQLDTMFGLAMRHEPMRRQLIRELARVGAGGRMRPLPRIARHGMRWG